MKLCSFPHALWTWNTCWRGLLGSHSCGWRSDWTWAAIGSSPCCPWNVHCTLPCFPTLELLSGRNLESKVSLTPSGLHIWLNFFKASVSTFKVLVGRYGSNATQDKPFLIKIAVYWPEVTCLFLQSSLALCVYGDQFVNQSTATACSISSWLILKFPQISYQTERMESMGDYWENWYSCGQCLIMGFWKTWKGGN